MAQILYEICVDQGVPIEMRDGTALRATVFRPREPGRYPVIVERTPYDPSLRVEDGSLLASHDFVYVAQTFAGASNRRVRSIHGTTTLGNQSGWI